MSQSSFRKLLYLSSVVHLATAVGVTLLTILLILQAKSQERLSILVPLLASAVILAMAAGYLVTLAIRRTAGEVARATGLAPAPAPAVRTGTGADELERILHTCDSAAEMFRGAADRSPVGLIVTDAYGVVAYVNWAVADLIGADRESLPGRHLSRVLGGPQGICPPRVLDALLRAETISMDINFPKSDGLVTPATVTAWPLFDDDGRQLGACALVKDLSGERRRKQEWLAAERAFRYLRDEIYVVDDKGKIIWTNKSTGLAGVDFLEHFCGGEKYGADGSYSSKIVEVLETGKAYSDQIVTSDDGRAVHRLNIKRLLDDAGRVIGCVSLCVDVTEEFQLKEQVRRSERLGTIGELASTTAHELRNPLTAMRATAQLGLLAGNLPETREYFELIISEIDRLNQFISELVMLSKPESEPLMAMSLNDLVEQMLTLVHGKVLMGNVRVTTNLATGIPPVRGSRRLLKQAFLNLMTNAIQAMPQGGELGIVTRTVPGRPDVEVVISDTGVGMDPETLKRLFTPFFTTKETGTGIGLAVTHQIVVDLHGGDIKFTSAPGQGTTVAVYLPVAAEEMQEVAAASN